MYRTRRAAIATEVAGPKQMQPKVFPAPIAGWVTADSLIASRPNSARILDNWFPMQMSARLRGGSRNWLVVESPIRSLMAYNTVIGSRMFACTDNMILDATAPNDLVLRDENGDPLLDQNDDPLLIDEGTLAEVTGLQSGYFCYVNFSTDGGDFLVAVNGTDALRVYDGTSWSAITATSSPISITGVETRRLSHVSAYRSRLFFVEKDTFRVWYLPVNSLGGAAGSLSVAGIFQKGGAVLFTATWSLYAGDGLDDKFVIVSTEGEVAVYQGSNPGDIDNWSLVGRYEITPPMGLRAHIRAGGDLLIATREGIIPISSAIEKDQAALSIDAVSAPIEPDWLRESVARPTAPWELIEWDRNNLMLVCMPNNTLDEAQNYSYVANKETGGWCRYTGWDVQCTVVYQDWLYFGTRDGRVMQAETGGDDDGVPFVCTYVGNWDPFDALGWLKTVHQARATFLTAFPVTPQISVSLDYTITLPSDPPSPPALPITPSLWDIGLWDEAVWDQSITRTTQSTRWVSIGRTGYAIAPQVRMTSAGDLQRDTELVEVTFTYERGGLVV